MIRGVQRKIFREINLFVKSLTKCPKRGMVAKDRPSPPLLYAYDHDSVNVAGGRAMRGEESTQICFSRKSPKGGVVEDPLSKSIIWSIVK